MANTNPDYWFLEASAMGEYRAPHYTSNNRVTALVDGKEYFDHLGTRLAAMASGDFYYFTAWRATPGMLMRPDVPGSTLDYGTLLRGALQVGVDVRGMMWYVFSSIRHRGSGGGTGHVAENIDMVNLLNTTTTPTPAIQRGVLDRRLVNAGASHHQKTSILVASGEHWAYVGGIDVAPDRWDTPTHGNPGHRPREGFDAWHDVQAALQGPAVAQVYENFQQRWNDPTAPHTVSGVPGGSVPPPIPAMPGTPAAPPGSTHHVQLLRTLACRSTYSFLPGGEQTVRMAYERAIDRAEHFIYIEDQYLWRCTLASRLRAAADRGVKVVFVLAHEYDLAALRQNHNHLRHREFLDEVRRGPGAGNVFVFHLQRPSAGSDIYVHSKVMVVDDCAAYIGSANVGHRSHSTDSELHVAVVDADTVSNPMNGIPTTVCRFARDLRRRLWQEHLGVSTGLDDPIADLAAWPTAAGPTQVHHAVVHPTPPWHQQWSGLVRYVMNMRTRCP